MAFATMTASSLGAISFGTDGAITQTIGPVTSLAFATTARSSELPPILFTTEVPASAGSISTPTTGSTHPPIMTAGIVGDGMPTTSLIAIIIPTCLFLASVPAIVYVLWRKRRQRLAQTKKRAWPRIIVSRSGTLRTLARNVELDSKEKQELETVERAQELASRRMTRGTLARDVELEDTEKGSTISNTRAQELEARRSQRSSKSTIGDIFRRIARSASRATSAPERSWEHVSPREQFEIEASMNEVMKGDGNTDEELRDLRIQQGKALAEREAAEEREAELRRLIREREEAR